MNWRMALSQLCEWASAFSMVPSRFVLQFGGALAGWGQAAGSCGEVNRLSERLGEGLPAADASHPDLA
jgi:hypothetical protein